MGVLKNFYGKEIGNFREGITLSCFSLYLVSLPPLKCGKIHRQNIVLFRSNPSLQFPSYLNICDQKNSHFCDWENMFIPFINRAPEVFLSESLFLPPATVDRIFSLCVRPSHFIQNPHFTELLEDLTRTNQYNEAGRNNHIITRNHGQACLHHHFHSICAVKSQ